jgi:FKBP-type peptidyl-prolyl cis-trans isomerase FklB
MKLKTLIPAIFITILIAFSCTHVPSEAKIETEIDSVSYWIGLILGESIQRDGFDSLNYYVVARAMNDLFEERNLLFDPDEANVKLREYYQALQQKKFLEQFEDNKRKGEKFLEENKKKEDIITLPSGLQYKILKEGTGPRPLLNDIVSVHYKGSLIDETVFESSYDSDPVIFGVDKVIPGWTEALSLMNVGSKWITYIPYQLAYGAEYRPDSPIIPYSVLIFEIELISIEQGEQDN